MARKIQKPGETQDQPRTPGDQDRADAVAAKQEKEEARKAEAESKNVEAAKKNGEEEEYRKALKERDGFTLVPEKKVADNHTVERFSKNVYDHMVIAKRVEETEE